MKFNQLISLKLHTLFTDHGLIISEQSKDIVRYESALLQISIVHNPKENSSNLWVGKSHSIAIEIDNRVMQEYFNSDLKLTNLPHETFKNNVFMFFTGEGKKLLEGSEKALALLEKFDNHRSSEYTANLVEKQNLEAANKAWNDGNYTEVIKYLDMINKNNLPKSLKQKYKIAQQRLDN